MSKLLAWLDDRTGYKGLLNEALFERIPGGAKWQYVWGSTLVFVFFVQVITGFLLWMGYSPSTRTAWESVYYIQHEMTLGWLIRGVHHFAAQAMVLLMVVHLIQVVVAGAYKAPRELNFWLGLVLMQIVLGLGLTGYLLPWDQKSYYATKVATSIMGSTPVVGESVQQLAQGGTQYGHHTLTRFFAMHAGVLPALLVAFLGLHIYVFRRHGITTKDPQAPASMFWPDQVLKDAVACLAILAGLMALAAWKGAELAAPANPAEAYEAARPEWYYLFLFQFLKFEWVSQAGKATHLGEAFGAVVLPGILMGILVLMPILGRWKWGHRFNVAYLFLVIAGAAGLTGLAIYKDYYAVDKEGLAFREAVHEAHLDSQRVVALAKSPTGIPPEGALALAQNDPLMQGPRLFKKFCADCHQPQSLAGKYTRPPEAPELADLVHREKVRFGSREWIKTVLTKYDMHFASLKNVTGERAEQAQGILTGNMAEWSKTNGPLLEDPANAADTESLIEFLYAQSGRADALTATHDKVIRGRAIFATGQLTSGAFDSNCMDCHGMHVAGEAEALSSGLFPDLTGYAGQGWLRQFIKHPSEVYAGIDGHNAMPAFADQLSASELELIVRWMTGDYYTLGGREGSLP